MVATAAGTIASRSSPGVTNIEQLILSSGGNNVTLTNGLVAGTSFGFFAVVDGGGNERWTRAPSPPSRSCFSPAPAPTRSRAVSGNDVVFFATDLTSADTFQGGAGRRQSLL